MKIDVTVPTINEFGEPRTPEVIDFETRAEYMRQLCLNKGGRYTAFWRAVEAGKVPGWGPAR